MTGEKFDLGRVVITATCLRELGEALAPAVPHGPQELAAQIAVGALIARHQRGEWGDVSDPEVNEEALTSGARLLSAYTVAGVKVWVITDGDTDACPACTTGFGTCQPDLGEWQDGIHFRTDQPPRRLTTTVLLPEDY